VSVIEQNIILRLWINEHTVFVSFITKQGMMISWIMKYETTHAV
jgi:hypothetical protein